MLGPVTNKQNKIEINLASLFLVIYSSPVLSQNYLHMSNIPLSHWLVIICWSICLFQIVNLSS